MNRWRERGAIRALALVLAAVMVLGVLPLPVQAAGISTDTVAAARPRAVDYLRRAQVSDGGFGSPEFTAWAVMGLALAGEDVGGPKWTRGGETPVSYLEKNPGTLAATTDYARLLLAVSLAGANGRDFAGRDLAGYLLAGQDAGGHFGRQGEEELVNSHVWSIIALGLAGVKIPNTGLARKWLEEAQNEDGGWGYARGLPSDPDDTATAILALRLLGVSEGDPAIGRALAFLRQQQLPDGGFAYGDNRGNAGSDAMVILALLAAGRDPLAVPWTARSGGPVAHLLGLQAADGSFMYRQAETSYPVWMTSQALIALSGWRFLALLPRAPGFTDLPAGHWAYEAVTSLAASGIINGYPDGTFKPENSVTRAEFAKIIVYAMGQQDQVGPATEQFNDVGRNHWANAVIKVAVDKGYLRGRGKEAFAPGDKITGAEVVAILVRAAGLAGPEVEARGPAWYSAYLDLARQKGFLYPDFAAAAPATRAQCAYSIARLLAGR
ncbi:MAG: hypothetical protein D9V47_03965 [Clostridia bacterium]|nr:MAG: hypothetical protein D9V47_03965 [Clostridia bacterium]